MTRKIKILDRQCVPAGTLIIEQGASGSRAYIIESGKVEVFMQDSAGAVIKITELGPGALIGEIALADDGHRSASVRALETTTLISVPAHDFHKAMKKSETLQQRLTRAMAGRVEEMLTLLGKSPSRGAGQNAAESADGPLLLDRMVSTLERLSAKLRKEK